MLRQLNGLYNKRLEQARNNPLAFFKELRQDMIQNKNQTKKEVKTKEVQTILNDRIMVFE